MSFQKKVFTILFIVSISGLSIYNIYDKKNDIISDVKEIEEPKKIDDVKMYTLQIDSALVSNMSGDHFWNEAYGAIYNVIGKNEENNFKYVRDKNGHLFGGDFLNIPTYDAKDVARGMRRLMDMAEEKNTKVVAMIYPSKYNEKWSDGSYGMVYQEYNKFNDELFRWLRYYDVPYVDYKDYFENIGWTEDELYYKTDRHWTVKAAFAGFIQMTRFLNRRFNAGLDEYYLGYKNYKIEEYENVFLGSQGRDASVAYAGLDDYTTIIPKFDTNYEIYHYTEKMVPISHNKGNITDTLITREKYFRYVDYYKRDLNKIYLEGVCHYTTIKNLNNPDGLKVLYIRDSYASPVAVFFSSYCSQTDLIWGARANENFILQNIDETDYDYIFIAMASDSAATTGYTFFMDNQEASINE